jgi:hypothetical protein
MGTLAGLRESLCTSCHTYHVLKTSALCVRAYRYRYQLEAFVDKLRGRDPEHWFDAQDSIANMEWIEAMYKEVGHILFPSPFNWSLLG